MNAIRTVKKGHYRFWPVIWGFCGKSQTRTVGLLEEESSYDIGDQQADWVKLFGVMPFRWAMIPWVLKGRKPQHYESYRWAYRYYQGRLQHGLYWYKKGVRGFSVVKGIPIGKQSLQISQEDDCIVWRKNGAPCGYITGKLGWINWKLGSYFVGGIPAPKIIRIWVR